MVMEEGLQHLAEGLGVPTDQVKLVICMMLAVVLGWVHWRIVRGEVLRHLFALIVGLSLALFQYGTIGLFGFAVTSVGTYLMLFLLPRERVAFPVFLFCFSYLSYVHIYRMYYDWMGWSQDYSTMQMVLTCKLTALAYNYQDGAVLVRRKKEEEPLSATELEQEKYAVAKMPSLLEYYSYLAFFGSFLVGPVFEYTDYIRFIKREKEFVFIPTPVARSLQLMLQSILCICGFLFLFRYFHYAHIRESDWGLHPYWYRILYLNFAMIGCKLRYYTGFKFGEAGNVASGFGYQGIKKDGSVDWDRARGVHIRLSEFAATTKQTIDNWNISVSLWLRRYIYSRLAGRESSRLLKSFAQHLTMIVSAFWHGFYPSYYVTFFAFSLLTEVSKMGYQSDFSRLPGRPVLKFIARLWMYTTENLNGIVFAQLGLGETLAVLNNIYWGPYLVLVAVWVFFKVTGFHRKSRDKPHRT